MKLTLKAQLIHKQQFSLSEHSQHPFTICSIVTYTDRPDKNKIIACGIVQTLPGIKHMWHTTHCCRQLQQFLTFWHEKKLLITYQQITKSACLKYMPFFKSTPASR